MDHEVFLSNLNHNLETKPVNELKNEQFSLEVASGRVKFLTVVESLQGVLTSENVSIREKGLEFLSWLLSLLPKELFNCSEIRVLLNFYCDCLKEHHNLLPPAIRGILELVKMKLIIKEDLVKILVSLFQHVNCQTQLQPDRVNIYLILKFVIENCLEDVKQMGPDFVYGVISLIEGEADPFCLIHIFSFLPLFIKNFTLGHLTEEMFEVLSCYFPIDFNTSSKENITISREDLSEGLHQCLSATDSFSELSISLILEKADSSFKNAKLDSYKLLQDCCQTLRVESLEKHINHLWKILLKDILPGNEKQICSAGLSALTHIFHLFSKDTSHEKILFTFLDDMLMTIRSLNNRIDENMFQPSIKVLTAAASQSKPATSKILCNLKTVYQLQFNNTLKEQKIILSSFLPFLRVCQKFKIMESQDTEEVSNYLELVTLYLNAATSVDYEIRKLAFMGILEILFTSDQEFRKRLYEIIKENITAKDDIKISQEFVKVWRNLAENHQSEIYSFISEIFSNKDTKYYFPNMLWAVSLIADIPKYTNYVILTFINVIDGKEKHVVALESLLNACKASKINEPNNFFQVIHSEHNLVEHLIFWCLEFKPKEEQLNEGNILNLLCEIIALVTRNQNSHAQQILADRIIQMFLQETSQSNGNGNLTLSVKNLSNFSLDLVQTVSILEAVLGSVRPEIKIPKISVLREKLTYLALNSTDDSVRLSSSRLLATFVNKVEESLALGLLAGISRDIFTHLEDNVELQLKLNSTVLLTWMVKGVVLRGSLPSEEFISSWFELLGRIDIGTEIAEGFRTVIEESDLFLNLESHCNIRVLYRQRLFGSHSILIKMYETSNGPVKMNYLLALVRLLQGVPIHLVQTEIANIITILVQCLDAEKLEVLLTSLEILSALLESKEKIFSDYVQSFVPKFLKLARFEGCMKIRINALKCLYFYGFYPTVILLPLKIQVIRDLDISLDDKKRLVRKEAVRARCRWFLIGAPGEDILE